MILDSRIYHISVSISLHHRWWWYIMIIYMFRYYGLCLGSFWCLSINWISTSHQVLFEKLSFEVSEGQSLLVSGGNPGIWRPGIAGGDTLWIPLVIYHGRKSPTFLFLLKSAKRICKCAVLHSLFFFFRGHHLDHVSLGPLGHDLTSEWKGQVGQMSLPLHRCNVWGRDPAHTNVLLCSTCGDWNCCP